MILEARYRLFGLLLPVLLIAIWQVAAISPAFPVDTLSDPFAILSALIKLMIDGTVTVATFDTLVSGGLGLTLGAALGGLAGLAVGLWHSADRLTSGITEFLRPVPAVALLPLALLLFGFGSLMEISIVAFAVFWPVMIIMRGAIRNIDPQILEVATALEFRPFDRLVKFLLPSIQREIFVALKIGIGVAFVVAVTVEIVVNPRGLGYQLVLAQVGLKPDKVFAFLFWVGLVGWGASAFLDFIEKRLFSWHQMER